LPIIPKSFSKIWESAKKKRNVDVTTDNKEIVVTTKKIIWGDWRDWFFDEEDKPPEPEVHHTEVKLYLDEWLICKTEVPINFETIKFNLEIPVKKSMEIEEVTIEIPEMGMRRTTGFGRGKVFIGPGDTIRLDHELRMET